MKHLFRTLFFVLVLFVTCTVDAQVLDPNDPVVTYDPANPPQQPPFGQVGDWVRTKRVGWNTDDYKAYIYKGLRIRLKFPKNYDANADKRYPVAVMFHGRGEKSGDLYDNEKQLVHAARDFQRAIDNGSFDGYALFPQSYGGFSDAETQALTEFIEYMVNNAHVDPYRVNIHGLSNGGKAVWAYLIDHPTLVASALPMSGTTSDRSNTTLNEIKYTPIWNTQGGRDKNPSPGYSSSLFNTLTKDFGGNMRYTLYPNLGHGVWNTHYREPDFFPFLTRANKTNPWPLYERKEFCPGDAINVTLGLTPGFEAYEWRKNGAVIAGATSHQLTVTTVGTYDARVKRKGVWSYWSPVPVEVKVKAPTQTPPVAVAALHSTVIPSPDGRNYTVLELPEGFEAYEWKKVGSNTVLGRERTLEVSTPGEYVATVTEKFGCSSNPSDPFKIVSASGANAPDPATGASAITLSKTAVKVAWSDNPSATYDETAFEIYRSTQSGGPYDLVQINEANVLSYTDTDLQSGQPYYYVIRAVNENGAATLSNETSATTQSDTNAPTAPLSLTLVSNSTTTVTLSWAASTDDVGVDQYFVYRNGTRVSVTDETSTTIFNLTPDAVYNFTVKAVDLSGNLSPASNQVVVKMAANGLIYTYYEGTFRSLPDFNALTVVKTGQADNVSISPRRRDSNFALKFEGVITVPTDGEYTFYTSSDDGSKLYIDAFDEEHRVVNNDGQHGNQERSGTVTLDAGSHAFFLTYFQGGGGKALEVRWQGPGISKQRISSEAFQQDVTLPGTPPQAPSQLVATAAAYNQVDLTWTDNSDNETGFQMYRSNSANGTFQPIKLTDANQTAYSDINLQPETTYYYRLLAVGEYGESDYAGETAVNITTLAAPVAPAVPTNVTATPASASRIALSWEDQSSNETGFEIYRAAGSGSDYLPLATLEPASGTSSTVTYMDQDLFANITYSYQVRALGTVENSAFSSVVSAQTIANGNHDPSVSDVADVTVPQFGTTTVSLSSSDSDGDDVSLSGQDLPAFATLVDNGDGTGTLTIAPQDNAVGDYTLSVVANDGQGGTSTASFTVTVAAVKTTFSVSVNFHKDGNTAAPSPWNNISSTSAGSSIDNMVNENNQATGMNLTLVDQWAGVGDQGVSNGLYPSRVNKSYFYTWQNEGARRVKVSGLNSNYKYSFTFFASRANKSDNRKTIYTIGGETVTLDPVNNGSNTVSIENVAANAQGEITIVMDKAAGSRNAYINALTINATFDNGNAPTAPTSLTATLQGAASIKLSWEDNALNETGYEIYRSNGGTNYSLVTTTGANVTTYTDQNLAKSVTYQYKVRATNANGTSDYTNVAEATTTNLPATPSALAGKTLSDSEVQITWTDNATNESGYKVYRASSKSGTYTTVNTLGANSTSFTNSGLAANQVYYYKVSAQNNEGESVLAGPVAVATRSFSVYINFSIPDEPAPSPWNNTGDEPTVGNTYNNLKNQSGTSTGIDMAVIANSKATTFDNFGFKGVVTGDNSGIYPDAVLKSYWWIEQIEVGTLEFDNLDLGMKYDLVFFGSRAATSRGTDFTINGTTVTLDVSNNTSQTVEINNVSPNSEGKIVVDMTSMSGAILAYVGAIVIHASPSTGEANARTVATNAKKSSIAFPGLDSKSLGNARVYPNPFVEQFVVGFELDDNSTETFEVAIYDITGSVVYAESLSYDYETEGVTVDVAEQNIKSGSYIVRITSAQGVHKSLRLMKY